jgi:hypothetical protein
VGESGLLGAAIAVVFGFRRPPIQGSSTGTQIAGAHPRQRISSSPGAAVLFLALMGKAWKALTTRAGAHAAVVALLTV